MSIRLCQACLHEIKEGDKLCSNCMVSVNRHATVVEVMSEYEGYSYVSNRYAFHDENLNNYNPEILKDSKNSRLYPDNIENKKKEEEDFEYIQEEDTDFVRNIIRLINNPAEYKDIMIGLIGCILLVMGNVITIYNNLGDLKSSNNVYLNFVTVFIMAAAFLAVLLLFKHRKKYVLIPTIISGMMLLFVMFDVETLDYLDSGYCFMWGALVLLVFSATINTQSRMKKYFLRKKDMTWIMLTFFLSLGLVNTFSHYIGDNSVEAGETAGGVINSSIILHNEEVKNITIDEKNIDVEMSLLDSYLVRYEEKDMVVVELSVYNDGKKEVKLNDYLDIFVMHNENRISIEEDIENITYFEMCTGDEKIGVAKCKTMFFGFFVEDKGDSYLNILNKETNESIISQMITLNSKFYVQPTVQNVPDGSSEGDTKEKDIYTVYFKKPANWSDNVYGYIYYIDGGTVIEKKEWPGTRMTSSGDMYVMKYDKEWFDKGKLIIVDKENEENVFPKKDSLGLKLEGNINIMPKK